MRSVSVSVSVSVSDKVLRILRSTWRLLPVYLLCVSGGATGCTRTPPEPASVASTRGATADDAPSLPRAADPALCPRDPEARGPLQAVAPVLFPGSKGLKVDAELARTPAETERGLMYRTSMAEDKGMLFRLEKHVEHTFWMRNTCIPLDMLFVEDDGVIVGIVESVPTLNEAPRTVGLPSSWVLEVNAGWSRRHGIRAGQRLVLPAAALQ